MKAIKKKPLLSTNNAKTVKGEKLGFTTLILYMTPYTDNSKGINVCSHASKGCASACLVGSGFGGMYENVNKGRREKTERYLSNRVEFLHDIKEELTKALKKHEGKSTVVVRLNGTSDLPYEKFKIFEGGKNIFEIFPDVQFYDYTKNHVRFYKELPTNYHLTFSRSEENHKDSLEVLKRGFNVAMVFDKLPKTFAGFKVVNGDESDLRFLDADNVIVGLKYKKMTGKGADNTSAFKSGFAISIADIKGAVKRVKENILELDEH